MGMGRQTAQPGRLHHPSCAVVYLRKLEWVRHAPHGEEHINLGGVARVEVRKHWLGERVDGHVPVRRARARES